MKRVKIFSTILVMSATSAFADLSVTFQDGAPKDRFTIAYTGTCTLEQTEIVIDLGTAPAGLIFDITASGPGVDVFQPLEWVTGSAQTSSAVKDGETALALVFDRLVPGETYVFTVDIDDTTSTRQITVDASEMVGASLRVEAQTALFDATGRATLASDACLS